MSAALCATDRDETNNLKGGRAGRGTRQLASYCMATCNSCVTSWYGVRREGGREGIGVGAARGLCDASRAE